MLVNQNRKKLCYLKTSVNEYFISEANLIHCKLKMSVHNSHEKRYVGKNY